MFNMAIDWRYLSVNPGNKVKPLELTDKKPIKCLSDEEYARFMRVCNDEFPEFFAIFYTFIHTGMRSGELFNLKWEDIDLQSKVIYIRQKAGFIPKGKDNSTHEAKQRIIPIHDSLVEVLKTVKQKSEYVFVDAEGNHFSKHKPRRTLIRIAKIAGIDGISRLHELRHTFATQIMAKKGDIYRLKELLGHSDIRDTMKYVHTSTESLRDDVKALEGLDRRAVPAYILHENVPAHNPL
jgi:integrase